MLDGERVKGPEIFNSQEYVKKLRNYIGGVWKNEIHE